MIRVLRQGSLLLLLTLFVASGASGAQRAFAVRVELDDKQEALSRLYEMRIDVDGVFDGWARVYVDQEEYDKLAELGFRLTVLPDEGKIGRARMALEGVAADVGRAVPAVYHTYETLTADLQTIAADHSDIARLSSIGQSVQGRELWVMKITDNPDLEEDEPELAYISSMHGDEVVGKETDLQPDQLPHRQLRDRPAGHRAGGRRRDLDHALDESRTAPRWASATTPRAST